MIAFVNVFVESPLMAYVLGELGKLPNLEELYEVTGEYDIVSLVSTDDIEEFRDILVNKIMRIKGVRSTVTGIVLYSHRSLNRRRELRPSVS